MSQGGFISATGNAQTLNERFSDSSTTVSETTDAEALALSAKDAPSAKKVGAKKKKHSKRKRSESDEHDSDVEVLGVKNYQNGLSTTDFTNKPSTKESRLARREANVEKQWEKVKQGRRENKQRSADLQLADDRLILRETDLEKAQEELEREKEMWNRHVERDRANSQSRFNTMVAQEEKLGSMLDAYNVSLDAIEDKVRDAVNKEIKDMTNSVGLQISEIVRREINSKHQATRPFSPTAKILTAQYDAKDLEDYGYNDFY